MFRTKDLGIVTSTGHRNWAIAELAKFLHSSIRSSKIIEIPQSRRQIKSLNGFIFWPQCNKYLFMHHALAITAWNKGWINEECWYGIRYTHESVSIDRNNEVFMNAKFITVENSSSRLFLSQKNLDAKLIHFLPHPIDTARFTGNLAEKSRDVIFVSNFYMRKNPELILKVIKGCPDLQFTLFGKGWEKWFKFSELNSLVNFQYIHFSYDIYPQVLASHRVFCSLSSLEGGPVPLLESIAAGLKIVATDTGHIRDILAQRNSYNILPIDLDDKIASNALRKAVADDTTPFNSSIQEFSLSSYLRNIKLLLEI